MRRRTLVPWIGDSNAIQNNERNLLDALMKNECFDVFDYVVDEIWNIAINPLRSCGFAPYIMCMIEMVAHERFYKDVAHEPLRPAIPKALAHHRTSPPLDVAPSHTTYSGGASSSSSTNSGFLRMFRGTMCHRTDQHMDVMDHRIDILHRNQEIIHSQRDEPLIEFPEELVYPPVPDPYVSLTLAELANFGVGFYRAPTASIDDDGSDYDEEVANDDKEMEDDE
jgi:hypothetical protein